MWPRIHNRPSFTRTPPWTVKNLARVSHLPGYLLGHTTCLPCTVTLASRSVWTGSTPTHIHTYSWRVLSIQIRPSGYAKITFGSALSCLRPTSLSRSRLERRALRHLIFRLWIYLTFRIFKAFCTIENSLHLHRLWGQKSGLVLKAIKTSIVETHRMKGLSCVCARFYQYVRTVLHYNTLAGGQLLFALPVGADCNKHNVITISGHASDPYVLCKDIKTLMHQAELSDHSECVLCGHLGVCARVMCMQTWNLINSLAFASASASVRYGDRVRGTSCLNKPTNRQRTHTKLFSLKKLVVAENISLWWSNKSFPRCISAAIFECNFSSNCKI